MTPTRLAADLARRIAGGEWADGGQLPPERELALEYAVARNTLRRALASLQEQGRLIRHVGRGTFAHASTEPAMKLRQLLSASPQDVMEVRLILEPQAAALAAARASADDVAEIVRWLSAGEAARAVQEFERADAGFHAALFRAAKNALLAELYDAVNAVRNQPRWFRLKQRTLTPERLVVYRRQHRAIVTAIRDRDGEAARRAASGHLVTVRGNLIGINAELLGGPLQPLVPRAASRASSASGRTPG